MSNIQFITDALNIFAESTSYFRGSFEDVDSFRCFLSGFGWELDSNIDETGFAKVQEAFGPEIAFLDQMDGGDAQRAIAVPGLISSLMTNRTADVSWPAPLNSSLFWSEFPQQLLDSFIWQMIQSCSPLAYALLRFGAVLKEVEEDEVVAEGSDPSRLSYLRKSIDWEQFVNFLADPKDAFKTAYNWSGSDDNFPAEVLLKAIGAMFEMLPVASVVMDAPARLYEKYFDSSLPTSPEKIEMLSIMPYMLRDTNGDPIELLKVSLNALPIPAEGTNTGSPSGIVIFPIISGSAQTSLSLGEGITLVLNGNYASSPVNAEIRPGSVAIELSGTSGTSLSGSATVEVENKVSPWVIIGSSDGPRFEVTKAHVEFAVTGTIQNPIFAIRTALDKASVVIDFSSSDGFLQKVFGDSPQHINTELTVGWSSQGGFQISGGAVLDLTIPVHETLFSTITVDYVKIKLGTDATDLKTHFNAGIVASLKLGPIDASVNNVGFKLGFKPTTDGSGNIGIFDVSLGFLPPTGIGLSLNTGPVAGGGFLDFDTEKQRYSGVLTLTGGGVGVVAIGLITTRMPDGTDGFSMLVSITTIFNPPVELYMRFTLSGIGGLIGVNRSMSTEELRKGIKTGSIDSIMFPDPSTVIANASKIISDMRSVFPVAEGQFVIGPMLKLGWGSPVNIIVADLGIFIEIGISGSGIEVARVVLMGQAEMALPTPEQKTIGVNIDILGILDLEKKEASFQSAIKASSLMAFKMYGDCAFLVSWGGCPDMALAIGGFHPQFSPPSPPSVFADLRRMSLVVNYGPMIELGCTGYLAVTPNSIQLGAQVHVFVGINVLDIGEIGIRGYLGFDSLIIFSPFSFEFSLCSGMTITAMGVTLAEISTSFSLSGPKPWNAHGKAVFKVLLWDVEANFDITWGESCPATRPLIDPWEEFKDALTASAGWGTKLPPRWPMVESLASLEEEEGTESVLVVHPVSMLEVRQNVLPLNINLEKFGNAMITGHDRFEITAVTSGDSGDLSSGKFLDEYFARGQFENLDDVQKLSYPSFERMDAGIPISRSNAVRLGTGDTVHFERSVADYDSIVLINDGSSPPARGRGTLEWPVACVLTEEYARTRAYHRRNFRNRFIDSIGVPFTIRSGLRLSIFGSITPSTESGSEPALSAINAFQDGYRVVYASDLTTATLDPRVNSSNRGLTKVGADQARLAQLAIDPSRDLLVVAEHEVTDYGDLP